MLSKDANNHNTENKNKNMYNNENNENSNDNNNNNFLIIRPRTATKLARQDCPGPPTNQVTRRHIRAQPGKGQ